MPRIDLNLDDVVEYVPAGWYPVRVTGAEVKKSQNNPKDRYVLWELRIEDPESKYDGEELSYVTMLTRNFGQKQLKAMLKALRFDEYDEEGFNTEDVLGNKAEVRVETEKGEGGQMNSNVEEWRPLE